MDEFTIPGLRMLREAARHGSFSIAADRLGYTQSAISRQVGLMERAAGRPLFERHARGVRPTDAGRVVLRHAEAVLGELAAARQDLDDLGAKPPGRLRVGAFSTAMAALVPRAIATLVAREPRAGLPLREATSPRLLTAVERSRLDLAVVTETDHVPQGVELLPLLEDPLLLAVPQHHRLAGSPSVAPSELRNERWIAGSPEPGTTLLGAWQDAAWRPDIAYVARDWVAKLGLVAAGLGITVVPGLALPTVPAALALVRIDHPRAVRATSIARRSGAPEKQLAPTFTEALRDTSAELAAESRRRLRVPF